VLLALSHPQLGALLAVQLHRLQGGRALEKTTFKIVLIQFISG
jgi:hypothetical protein